MGKPVCAKMAGTFGGGKRDRWKAAYMTLCRVPLMPCQRFVIIKCKDTKKLSEDWVNLASCQGNRKATKG